LGSRANYNDLRQTADRYTADLSGGREYRYDAAGRNTAYLDYEFDCTGGDLWDKNHGVYCNPPPTKIYHANQEYYTYDKVGNRTDLGAVIGTGNRLLKFNGDSLVYDADGNLIRRMQRLTDIQRLHWNSIGQLTSVWTTGQDSVNFAYDAFGRRVRKWSASATSRYIWDGDDLIAEVDGAGNRVVEYTYYPGVDQPHSQRRGTATSYYVQDFPGNVVGLVDGLNTLLNAYKYKPFGADDGSPTPIVGNALRYAAREFDSETGLYYIRARYYDPQLGRFISEDPIGLLGGINLYAYAWNDPINARDPSGMGNPVGIAVGGLSVVARAALVAAMASALAIAARDIQQGRTAEMARMTGQGIMYAWATVVAFVTGNGPPRPPKRPEDLVPPTPYVAPRGDQSPPPPPWPPNLRIGPPGGAGSAAGSGGSSDIVTCFPVGSASVQMVGYGPPRPAGVKFQCSDGSTFWM
jgi:RHS repeat-associated protein